MPRIHCDQKLNRCENEQLGVSVPVPLNRLIGTLCDIARETGILGEVTRKEMVAAILFDMTEAEKVDGERLVAMVQAYRTATADRRMPEESRKSGYFDYEEPRRGRPSRA